MPDNPSLPYCNGISWRDVLAACAMVSLMLDDEWSEESEAQIAKLAYLQADAMLIEREKKAES